MLGNHPVSGQGRLRWKQPNPPGAKVAPSLMSCSGFHLGFFHALAGIVTMMSKKSGLASRQYQSTPHDGSPTSGAETTFNRSKTVTWATPAAQNQPLPVSENQR